MNRGKKKQTMLRRMTAVLLVLCLVCNYQIPAMAETAATLKMQKTEGTVKVANNSGKSLSLIQNMSLYNGYQVATEAASYAWINLDDTKLTKLDEVSDMEIRSKGKELELLLNSGNLYFNVTAPLTEDETLNIRTSSMVMGIRGTAGWVKVIDRWHTRVYLLEGTLQCAVTDPVSGQRKSIVLHGGDMAEFVVYDNRSKEGDKCDIFLRRFTEEEIDGFVLVELVQDEGLCRKIYADSGLNILPLVDQAQDRLAADQAAMRQKLAEIQEKVQQQANHISVDPVWTDNQRNNDSDDSSGSSTPALGETVVLTMPVTAQMVHDTLATNGVRHVIIQPSDQGVSFGDARSFQARQMVAGKIIGRTVQMWAPVSTSVGGTGEENSESGIAAQADGGLQATVEVFNLPTRGYFRVGEEAIFKIRITNIGDQTLNRIRVQDNLAEATLNAGAQHTQIAEDIVEIEVLGIGEETEIYAHYTVTRNDLFYHSIRNTVTVTAEDGTAVTADSGLIPAGAQGGGSGGSGGSGGGGGSATPGTETDIEPDVLIVDVNVHVPSGKDLTVKPNVNILILEGRALQIDGTLETAGDMENNGIIENASGNTFQVNGSFTNQATGTVNNARSGRIIASEYINNEGTFTTEGIVEGAIQNSGTLTFIRGEISENIILEEGAELEATDSKLASIQAEGGHILLSGCEVVSSITQNGGSVFLENNTTAGSLHIQGAYAHVTGGTIATLHQEAGELYVENGTIGNLHQGVGELHVENTAIGNVIQAGGTADIFHGTISDGYEIREAGKLILRGCEISSGSSSAALLVDTGLDDPGSPSVNVDMQSGTIDGEDKIAVNLISGYMQLGHDVQIMAANGTNADDILQMSSVGAKLVHFSDSYVDSGGVREISSAAIPICKADQNGVLYLEKISGGIKEALEAAQGGEIVTVPADGRLDEGDAEVHILGGDQGNPVKLDLNGKTVRTSLMWIGNGYEDDADSNSGALEVYDSRGGIGRLVIEGEISNSRNSSLILKNATYTHCDPNKFLGDALIHNYGHLEIQDGAEVRGFNQSGTACIETLILGEHNGNADSYIEIGTKGERVDIWGEVMSELIYISGPGKEEGVPEKPLIVVNNARIEAKGDTQSTVELDGTVYAWIMSQAEITMAPSNTSDEAETIACVGEFENDQELMLEIEKGAQIKNKGSNEEHNAIVLWNYGDMAEDCIREALEKGVEIKTKGKSPVIMGSMIPGGGSDSRDIEEWRLSDYKVSDEPDEEGYYYYVKADPARAIQPLLATPSQAEMILDEDIQGEQEELPNVDDSQEKGEYVNLATPSQAEEISHEDLILDEEMIFDEDLILDEDALPDDDPVDEDDQDGNEEERGKPFVNFARDTESSVEKDLEISLSEEAEDSGSSKAEPYPEKEAAALPEGKKRGDQEEVSLPEDNLQGDQEHSALPEIYVRDDEDSADRPEEKRQSSEIPILPDEMFQTSQETAPPEEQPEAALTGQEEEGSE